VEVAETIGESHGRSDSFSDLVWAHFLQQRALHREAASPNAQIRAAAGLTEESEIYYDVLARFQASHGLIIASMFGARRALGVAVTEREDRRSFITRLRATPQPVHELHRSMPWSVGVPRELDAALHEGDVLAIQAAAVLRRAPARAVVMRVFAAQSYLLETIDRGLYESEEVAAESADDESLG